MPKKNIIRRTSDPETMKILVSGLWMKFSTCDLDLIAPLHWHRSQGKTGGIYARSYLRTEKRYVYMHRLICATPKGFDTDHVNRNSLDNRRNNLRAATRSENSLNALRSKSNKSGYKGVCWDQHTKRWRAYITFSGKQKSLGYFKVLKDAGDARARAEP